MQMPAIGPLGSTRALCLAALLGALPITANALDDKSYLDALDKEASKVEVRRTGEKADAQNPHSAATQLPLGAETAAKATLNREQFEEKLKQEHLGTYTLYMKLSPRSKDELFESYSQGTSMDSLRDKILSRIANDNIKN